MDSALAAKCILMVDENPEHIRIIQQVLSDSQQNYQMQAIANGNDALDFLHHRGQYSQAPRPDLILLDLNLSTQNGLDILTTLKTHEQLRRIPIIILTLTHESDSIFKSYALQGNCYVIKSPDLQQLAHIVKRIEEFWLDIVTLPIE